MIQDPLFLVSVNLFGAVVLRCIKPNVFTALILTVVMIASTAYLGTKQGEHILTAIYQSRDYALSKYEVRANWPPALNRKYPDLLLRDHVGNLVRLSDFQGKVILVEPVGMSCPACIAFSGGHDVGAFQGVSPQPNLQSIQHYAESYGNVSLDHPDVIFVQLLLFNQKLEAPTPEETAEWANHFPWTSKNNHLVLSGTPDLAGADSHGLVPGFQLIDKNFILRMDSTGEKPANNLYGELIPAIGKLIEN